MKLILGSSSKYRKELLEKAGYVFDILAPELDEKAIQTSDPYERPLILARAKMYELIQKVTEPAIIITSDIVIVGNGKLYEKPESEEEARDFSRQYNAGLVPETVGALVVANTETGERFEGVDRAKVFFKHFPDSMIEEWIQSGEALKVAGGFGISHPIMAPYVDKVEGDPDSVTGMPLDLLKDLLKKAKYFK